MTEGYTVRTKEKMKCSGDSEILHENSEKKTSRKERGNKEESMD